MLAPILAFALAPAPTPTVEDTSPTVDLDIDLSALPADDVTKGLEYFLIEHQTEVIRDAGLEVEDGAPFVIRIKVSRYGDQDLHSRADVALLEVGADAPRVARTVECELCRDGDLVMKVGTEVGRLSAQVLYEPATAEDEPDDPGGVPAGEAAEPRADDQAGEPQTAERAKVIGPLGYAGIGSAVLGAAGLASGIPLALRSDESRGGADGAEIRRTRPTGIALASIGGALLMTGAVLVSVDLVRRGKQRRVSFLPGPTMLGISARGRF